MSQIVDQCINLDVKAGSTSPLITGHYDICAIYKVLAKENS